MNSYLKILRYGQRKTLRGFAKEIGISMQWLWLVENGTMHGSKKTQTKIAKALGFNNPEIVFPKKDKYQSIEDLLKEKFNENN